MTRATEEHLRTSIQDCRTSIKRINHMLDAAEAEPDKQNIVMAAVMWRLASLLKDAELGKRSE